MKDLSTKQAARRQQQLELTPEPISPPDTTCSRCLQSVGVELMRSTQQLKRELRSSKKGCNRPNSEEFMCRHGICVLLQVSAPWQPPKTNVEVRQLYVIGCAVSDIW